MTENHYGTTTDFTYFGGVHDTNLSRKRLVDRSDEFTRPGKKPNLTSYWDSHPSTEPGRREQSHRYTPCSTEPQNFPGCGHKRITMDFQIIDSEKKETDELRKLTGSSSLIHDLGMIQGVVRLSAGVKHILRPCQDMGVDNARPIHSVIPFGIRTNSRKTPVSQKKTTKIYRF